MKQKFLLILVLTILVLSSCKKLEIEKGTPKCIVNLINDFAKEQSCENNVNVKKYTFQEKTVYVFDTGTCGVDMTSEVIDCECNSIGFLGGISGNTVINGEDFSNAKYESTTWER